MSEWFRDGEPVVSVPIGDRALQYGDGLFETIAVRDSELRLWDRHLARLRTGCTKLGLDMPDSERLQREVESALAHSETEGPNCVVKIIVSAGNGERGYGRLQTKGTVLVGVFPRQVVDPDAYTNGITTMLCKTRLAISSATAGLKTLNRLEQVLGRTECLRADLFEGLMRDADGRVICGTMSNVFAVSENSLVTPYLGRCGVAGVMRDFAIDVFRRHGLDVAVRDFEIDELWRCNEVFLTNSQFGALPVKKCEHHEFRAGRVTRDCIALLAEHGIAECAS
jgi:4-amino-4-deoxychorismate lyase